MRSSASSLATTDSSGQEQQIQPRQKTQLVSQRLPNECLYLIIGHCRADLPLLQKLLVVSRFFFSAALPYLVNDPSWHHSWKHGCRRFDIRARSGIGMGIVAATREKWGTTEWKNMWEAKVQKKTPKVPNCWIKS
ncbi:hypothetical protein EDD21DRAFT_400481 [Dissophora ornata]|nr:hypothetical protein EDD21DRAFT_400481 [Dissophora ornata]